MQEAATSFIGKAIGSVFGGITGTKAAAKGAQQAATTQAQSAADALALNDKQFNITRNDNLPFLEAGQQAVGAQGNLIGLGGADAQAQAIAALQNSPEFAALSQQGNDAILANASATGGLRGGNTQNSLARTRMDLLSSLIGQQYSRLGGIAGQGASTAANLGGLSGQFGAQQTGILGQQGAAIAGGQIAKGNQQQTAFNSALQLGGLIAGF